MGINTDVNYKNLGQENKNITDYTDTVMNILFLTLVLQFTLWREHVS